MIHVANIGKIKGLTKFGNASLVISNISLGNSKVKNIDIVSSSP